MVQVEDRPRGRERLHVRVRGGSQSGVPAGVIGGAAEQDGEHAGGASGGDIGEDQLFDPEYGPGKIIIILLYYFLKYGKNLFFLRGYASSSWPKLGWSCWEGG